MPRSARFDRFALGLLALGASACSWSRFGDVTENAPIEFLNRPDSMQTGFGLALTVGEQDGTSRLFVGGEPGTSAVSMFDLGRGESPNVDAVSTSYCNRARGVCFLGYSTAYLKQTLLPERGGAREPARTCLALGIGSTALEGNGIYFECEDSSFTRPVPAVYADDVDFAISEEQYEAVSLAADGADDPAILVAAPAPRLAWYYTPGSDMPLELVTPVKPDRASGFGTASGVVPLGPGSWLFVVSAPSADAVYLFRANGTASEYVGCLGGTPDFGRALALGKVLGPGAGGDEVADLVVSDRSTVHVFDGAALAALPAAGGVSCSLAALPERGLIASFGCGSTKDTSECSSSDFGAALAVGDVDGDGDGEVLVGAPQMTVHGEHGVGAVLIYDVERTGDGELTDLRYVASGEQGDSLGGSLAAASIGNRDVIVGGFPRAGKVGLFYCSAMVQGAERGARCE